MKKLNNAMNNTVNFAALLAAYETALDWGFQPESLFLDVRQDPDDPEWFQVAVSGRKDCFGELLFVEEEHLTKAPDWDFWG